jgi:hypothetical protein
MYYAAILTAFIAAHGAALSRIKIRVLKEVWLGPRSIMVDRPPLRDLFLRLATRLHGASVDNKDGRTGI